MPRVTTNPLRGRVFAIKFKLELESVDCFYGWWLEIRSYYYRIFWCPDFNMTFREPRSLLLFNTLAKAPQSNRGSTVTPRSNCGGRHGGAEDLFLHKPNPKIETPQQGFVPSKSRNNNGNAPQRAACWIGEGSAKEPWWRRGNDSSNNDRLWRARALSFAAQGMRWRSGAMIRSRLFFNSTTSSKQARHK